MHTPQPGVKPTGVTITDAPEPPAEPRPEPLAAAPALVN